MTARGKRRSVQILAGLSLGLGIYRLYTALSHDGPITLGILLLAASCGLLWFWPKEETNDKP